MGVPSSPAMFWYLDSIPVMTALVIDHHNGELRALDIGGERERPIQRGVDIAANEFVRL
jgi:hypothetical protein